MKAAARRSAWPRRAPVELAFRDGIAWLTLARPATGNALDADMMSALVDACAVVEDTPAVRVVVLRARGRVFSTGLPPDVHWPPAVWPDGLGAVGALTKPVIAAVQGTLCGWGVSLALACDLRIASSGTTLQLSEIAAGGLPGGGVLARLARSVGEARALELVLLGEAIAAKQAQQWGLLTDVVPPARLAAAGRALARSLVSRAPLALRLAKEAVLKALDLPLEEGMRLEHDLYVLLQTTHDRAEGVRAFLERRRPRFEAR